MTLFLLVNLLFLSPMRADGCLSDRNKDHRPRVSCVGMSLSSVPASIEPSTEVLVLSQNLFTSLSWDAYVGFKSLHELDLSQNRISVLDGSGLFFLSLSPPSAFYSTLSCIRIIQPISSILFLKLDCGLHSNLISRLSLCAP